MKKLYCILSILLFSSGLLFSQKAMTPEVYSEWHRIRNVQISNNGDWVVYQLTKEQGDNTLMIYSTRAKTTLSFDRTDSPKIDFEGDFVYFKIKHGADAVRDLRRKKTKKEDMPKDTLAIYDLQKKLLTKIPDVKSYKVPDKWSGYIAYHMLPEVMEDSLRTMAKETDKSGTKLIVRNIKTADQDTLLYAKDYLFAEEGAALAATSLGTDSMVTQGIYNFDFETKAWNPIFTEEGDYYHLSWAKDGSSLAFLADIDTTEARVRPYQLHCFEKGQKTKLIADQDAEFLPVGYQISNHTKPRFSDSGERLFFAATAPPVLQDTSLLDDEIVHVEVWNYNSPEQYTRQENNLEQDKKRDYSAFYDMTSGKSSMVANVKMDRINYNKDRDATYAFGIDNKAYQKYRMWLGHDYFDGYRINLNTGKKTKFAQKEQGFIQPSSTGRYALWFNRDEGVHKVYDAKDNKTRNVTNKKIGVFSDELNDRPMNPWSYGIEAFTKDDEYVLIYDRYDVWLVDPDGKEKARNLTNGRKDEIVHRVIDLDRDEPSIDIAQPLYIHTFSEKDKSEGYLKLDVASAKIEKLLHGNYSLDRSPLKAKGSNDIITTIESFERFPDLVATDLSFKKLNNASEANPQQKEYNWGKVSLRKWKSLDGGMLEGLLYVPTGFDPKKKYPLLVNFYERSSNRLHRHRAPYAHRSTINYTYYLSKGYVIFNPDISYEVGHPGQSCYDDVMSGIKSVLKEGFIDQKRIGVQGHSWGGYQIADLLTKTDIFKCAESGAPVVNMVSAYGGIRWGSGMSRMFQYEKTQSRLGGTLWEKPELYLENSPVFNLDKVTTPVLILHNDQDGAVPWYQGIEYFNGLRRLGKPSWMLNYNGEPHWPLKWQNRLDFNIRMEQFFDHYLMDKPMPRWMRDGVPAIKKGIDQGLDLIKE